MTKLESFLSKQSPEVLKKAGFDGKWFNREYEWYTEELVFALYTLGVSQEYIMEILKEELDILDKLHKHGDID